MEKIPSLFMRDEANPKLLSSTPHEDCGWVFDGEGWPTEKFDGTCCAVIAGKFYRRHALKLGKPMPLGWLHWTRDPEQMSGHGWAPVLPESGADAYHMEAWREGVLADGTYELVGPRVQRNLYGLGEHHLWRHGSVVLEEDGGRRTYDGIGAYLAVRNIEGIVYHHEDGRMAKIKRRDYGYAWGKQPAAHRMVEG